MKKIYKFKILMDYKPHINAGDILEGYYSSFEGYPVVMVGGMGVPHHFVEKLELVREESWVSPGV